MINIKESDLYLPIKAFFIENGYKVNGEVGNVDIVISKEAELIAIEMKTSFNLKLLTQAVERQKIFDSVYVAIPLPKKTYKNKRYNEIVHLLKRLGIGLITVSILKSGYKVNVEHHPIELTVRKNNKKKKKIIKEISERTNVVDNLGGTNKVKTMTAYREKAIFIACLLRHLGETSPKRIKEYNKEDKTANILYTDHYKWFERISRGLYKLSNKGQKALIEHKDIVDYFEKEIVDIERRSKNIEN